MNVSLDERLNRLATNDEVALTKEFLQKTVRSATRKIIAVSTLWAIALIVAGYFLAAK